MDVGNGKQNKKKQILRNRTIDESNNKKGDKKAIAGMRQREFIQTIDTELPDQFGRQPKTPKYIHNKLFIPSGDNNGLSQYEESTFIADRNQENNNKRAIQETNSKNLQV